MPKDTTVLFLDDEENILQSLKRLFMNESFGVVTTTDPNEAMNIVSTENIKVVLSDQMMPSVTGVEFLSKIKEKYPNILKIIFTGHSDVQAIQDSINIAEVYRFINKPWNGDDLKMTVSQALKYYDLHRENKKLYEDAISKNKELEEMNQRLKSMYEVQKDFTSTVSHELRTPLAAIKSTIDLVLSGTPGKLNKDQEKFLKKSKNNVDRLNLLIGDILDLSKLESGRREIKIETHDLGKLIEDVIEMQELAAKEKGLKLEKKTDKHIGKIPFDWDSIGQVMMNLVNNAIKFTEEGGIVISASILKDKNFVEVRVTDTGPGIRKEDISKLFERFQQLGDPALRKTGGTGLGLAICKEIVNRHGGKIWAESEITKGSSFNFLLPLNGQKE